MTATATIVKRRKPLEQLHRQPHHRIVECVRCHETVCIVGRGLCAACYFVCRKSGELADYPTTRHQLCLAELIEEYDLLASAGNTHEVIAHRLGYVNPYYLKRRVELARQAVDRG